MQSQARIASGRPRAAELAERSLEMLGERRPARASVSTSPSSIAEKNTRSPLGCTFWIDRT